MKVRVKLVSMDGPVSRGFDDYGEAELSFAAPPTVSALINQLNLGPIN